MPAYVYSWLLLTYRSWFSGNMTLGVVTMQSTYVKKPSSLGMLSQVHPGPLLAINRHPPPGEASMRLIVMQMQMLLT